jgi:uncharacterized protein involved in type VI secretion and phage assembly
MSEQRFYGKYRGIVADNDDPKHLGRIKPRMSDVLEGKTIGWALPCTPYAGKGVGLFLVPPGGASVWIEFEYGDPDRPIWSGCFWPDVEQMPEKNLGPTTKLLKTDKCTITIDDKLPGITITMADGRKITIDSKQKQIKITDGANTVSLEKGKIALTNSSAVEVDNGSASVKLSGSSVSINNGGLEVS